MRCRIYYLLAFAALGCSEKQDDPLLPQNSQGSDCPLAGPAFPAPSNLTNSPSLLDAALMFETQLGNQTGGLLPNDTAWAVAVFSAKSGILYERYHTPPIDIGVKNVDQNSIFRLASVSKVFTVYTILSAIGDSRFNDPITKYIPELANRITYTRDIYDDIDNVNWEDITLNELASQTAGIARDAFNLLAYALEAITGKDLETTMTESVFKKLGMAHSSYKDAPPIGGVIPGDPQTAGWARDLGVDNPGGSLYMSTGDLVRAGQSILRSTLIKPAETRRWLQPKMLTGYPGAAVGAPWEITYLQSANNRLISYFSKDGDIDAYHSSIVLSPEHEVGFTILVAGTADSNASLTRTFLKVGLVDIFMPAIEDRAKVEASLTFDGTYVDNLTNSTVVISAGFNDHPGLTVRSLVSRGVPLVGPGTYTGGIMASQFGVGNSTRLYPTTLKTVRNKVTAHGSYISRMGFRASFVPLVLPGTVQDPCILDWANLDGITYGRKALDDWVFEMSEEGLATGLNIRMLDLNLRKVV
ncbi:hypothetical protein NW759_016559 [Fusarium solani]|nr:hypothetical protein NW759_016559 [Fusarium solani]